MNVRKTLLSNSFQTLHVQMWHFLMCITSFISEAIPFEKLFPSLLRLSGPSCVYVLLFLHFAHFLYILFLVAWHWLIQKSANKHIVRSYERIPVSSLVVVSICIPNSIQAGIQRTDDMSAITRRVVINFLGRRILCKEITILLSAIVLFIICLSSGTITWSRYDTLFRMFPGKMQTQSLT